MLHAIIHYLDILHLIAIKISMIALTGTDCTENCRKDLKALGQPSQKFCLKILAPYFFLQQPLPKLPKTMLLKYFQNCMYSFRENWEIIFTNLTYCSSLQPVVVFNFSEIESTFPVITF